MDEEAYRTIMLNLQGLYRVFAMFILVGVVGFLFPTSGHTYVGPGAGLSVIGTIVALIVAVILAIVGFVWYPLKRILAKWKGKQKIIE